MDRSTDVQPAWGNDAIEGGVNLVVYQFEELGYVRKPVAYA